MGRMSLYPMRDVRDVHLYTTKSHPRGVYSKRITLSCGHVTRMKGSTPTPKARHCQECFYGDWNISWDPEERGQ